MSVCVCVNETKFQRMRQQEKLYYSSLVSAHSNQVINTYTV